MCVAREKNVSIQIHKRAPRINSSRMEGKKGILR